ncbi:MAG TPA: PAC2 family protein [Actinomycetota bacterium]|nr:PAC2 family protein [Actinomycetota bacterium]
MPLLEPVGQDEPFVAPAIVSAFDGWVDAAGASTTAAERIASDGRSVAAFDADLLFDFRSRRPVLDIVDGTLTQLTWPELSLRRARIGGRDLLVLTGAEPDFRWRELGRELVDLAHRVGVVEWVSLGSIPAAVPHTRPVPVLATASRAGLLHEDESQGPAGLLRVPAAALSTLEMAMIGSEIPTVGFYAQVPHYVGGPYAPAAIAMLEHAGRHLGVDIPLGPLPDEAMAQRERLDSIVQGDEDSRSYVQRLESAMDNQELPTGDELVSEIERFLQQGGDAGPGPIR